MHAALSPRDRRLARSLTHMEPTTRAPYLHPNLSAARTAPAEVAAGESRGATLHASKSSGELFAAPFPRSIDQVEPVRAYGLPITLKADIPKVAIDL